MTTRIEFIDRTARNEALGVLLDNGYVHSDYHAALIDEDYAIHSEIENDWYHVDDPLVSCARCEQCFHPENSDRIISEDGTDFCSESCASEANYHEHEDGCWYDYPAGILRAYHDAPRVRHCTSPEMPFLIGFEVEKEDEDCRCRLENGECELPSGWSAETDSSLDDATGFELISPAYNLSENTRILRDFASLGSFLDAECSVDCGGHITISKHGMSGYELAETNKGLFPLLMCLYPRRLKSSHVRWGKYSKIRESDAKYRPFRIDSYKIELRIIARVQSHEQLVWRYELIKWMLENAPTMSQTRESMTSQPGLFESVTGGWLFAHLSKVYSEKRIAHKLHLFDLFASFFYDDVTVIAPSDIQPYLTTLV